MDFEYTGIDLSKIQIQPLNPLGDFQADFEKEQSRIIDSITDAHNEKKRLEDERHKELISKIDETNRILNDKLSTANETLDFVLNSIGSNFQRIERQNILTNDLFLELCSIMKERNQHRLLRFLSDHSLEGIGLLMQFLAIVIGQQA